MADDAPQPPRPTGVRAGGTLDLSTGRPAPPPPEPPAPRPPVTPDPDVRVGKALDLSRGRGGTPRRTRAADTLGHGPVVRETVDLSTPAAPEAPTERSAPAAASAKKPAGAPKSSSKPSGPSASRPARTPRGVAPKSASSSLADLLDPEVLARLRGDG